MSDGEADAQSKKSNESPSTTTNPAEASGLQTGVGQILVDHELEQSTTVKIPQPKRRRMVFKY
jgi:hypothetical protein